MRDAGARDLGRRRERRIRAPVDLVPRRVAGRGQPVRTARAGRRASLLGDRRLRRSGASALPLARRQPVRLDLAGTPASARRVPAFAAAHRQDAAMPLTREQLDTIVATTLAHYDENAEEFWHGTRDHDVSQNIAALLRHLQGTAAVRDPRPRLRSGARPEDVPRARPRARSASRARRAWRRWRAPGAAARSGSRTCSRSTCRRRASTACSPTRSCSTCRARRWRACSASCTRRSSPAACCSARTRAATAAKAGTAGASASITTAPRGRAISTPRASPSSSTSIVPQGLPREQQPWLASVWRRLPLA